MYTSRLSLTELAADLRQNKVDVLQFVNELCDRIEAVDPHLHALLPEADRRARLRREAEHLQQRYPDPDQRPSLYGIPVGVKDVLRVDGLPTRAGSRLPAELFAGEEAASVTMLREAGALILGKTVSTEFAYYEPGPTVNPHHTEHTPGGSSSGSTAAVAAGFCPLAFGTQTVGSVIRPAAFCGIVGFKPSYDRIPTAGIIHCSPALDHVGLFSQDVEGVRRGASILCRDWCEDHEPKTGALPVLGVPEGPYLSQMPAEGLEIFEAQLQRLKEAGYAIQRVPALENLEHVIRQHENLVAGDMATVHAEWFATYETLYRPRTKENILRGQQISVEDLAQARDTCFKTRYELESKMEKHGIDVWVCPPAFGPAPQGIETTGDPAMNLPWTNAGLPAITIPVDQSGKGLPLGLQLVARFEKDESLLNWTEHISHVFGSEAAPE